MQIHELRPKKSALTRKKKRVGRGGKRGTYSGKGQKGQRSRAGHRIRPAERDLIMLFPKLRGVKNRRKSPRAVVINVSDLGKIFPRKETITPKELVEAKVIKTERISVKILGGGDVKRPFIVQGIVLSAIAREKIEKAGGSVKE